MTGPAALIAAQRSLIGIRSPTGADFGLKRTISAIASRLTAIAITAGMIAARNRSRMNAFETMQ